MQNFKFLSYDMDSKPGYTMRTALGVNSLFEKEN
jgi:hypothetical protein